MVNSAQLYFKQKYLFTIIALFAIAALSAID